MSLRHASSPPPVHYTFDHPAALACEPVGMQLTQCTLGSSTRRQMLLAPGCGQHALRLLGLDKRCRSHNPVPGLLAAPGAQQARRVEFVHSPTLGLSSEVQLDVPLPLQRIKRRTSSINGTNRPWANLRAAALDAKHYAYCGPGTSSSLRARNSESTFAREQGFRAALFLHTRPRRRPRACHHLTAVKARGSDAVLQHDRHTCTSHRPGISA